MRAGRAAPARCEPGPLPGAGCGRDAARRSAAQRPGDGGGSFRAVTASPAASLALKMADGGDGGPGAGAAAAGGRVPVQLQDRAVVRLQPGATARFPLAPAPARSATPPLGRAFLAAGRPAAGRGGSRRPPLRPRSRGGAAGAASSVAGLP